MFYNIRSKNRLLFVIVMSLCLLIVCSFTAGALSEVTVSKTPAVGEYGTIQAGIGALTSGGTVKIKPGIYQEWVSIEKDNIRLEKEGVGEVVVDAQRDNTKCGITVTGASNIELIGLTVINVGAWADNERELGGIRINGGCDNVLIDYVKVDKCKNGISLYNPAKITEASDPITNVQITNSRVSNSYFHGIDIRGDIRDVLVKKNVLSMSGAWSVGLTQINGGEREIIRGSNIHLGYCYNPLYQYKVPHYISIVENESKYALFEGIDIWDSRYVLVKNNHFHHNAATGLEQEAGVEYFVYEDNLVEWNQQNCDKELGIWIGDCKYGVVRNNTVLHERWSMAVWGATDAIIRHNVFANFDRKAYHHLEGCIGINFRTVSYMSDELGDANERISFLHNTMYTPGTYALKFRQGWNGAGEKVSNTDFHIFNNLISTTKKWEYNFEGHTQDLMKDFQVDYNCYFNPFSFSPTDKLRLRCFSDDDIRYQDYWQTEWGFDLEAVFTGPQFNKADEYDFTLDGSSPARNAGTYLAYTVGAGEGTVAALTELRYFTDGFDAGCSLEKALGDEIQIGYQRVRITKVNKSEGTIEFTPATEWTDGTPVSFVYYGEKPDMGKEEFVEADPTQWEYPHNYVVGDTVFYNGEWYTCIQAHTSNETWMPDVTKGILWN